MKADLIRKKFFEFFQSKKHRIVDSAPLVVKDDPTLMFNNAGMNQFKEFFLGNTKPQYRRIADTQKCLRVSGKHNDLEQVGIDTYHHTFFEMLGNWSFGDYFKNEAITWAWEFLTDVLKIDKERIYVTVFEGSSTEKVAFDKEAHDLWKRYLDDTRILKFGKKENFWEMGEQGPCGPCSEIHVDIRSKKERNDINGATLVNQDHPQVIEIWNLVFIQYNRLSDGSLVTLPEKHVDTGMGFERLCMTLQQKRSTYDTDVFIPLINEIEIFTSYSYGASKQTDVAIRVLADHMRTICFSIADGQLPSNKDAGYVIRRILRRAIRYSFSYLGMKKPFIYRLVPVLSKQMLGIFPELKREQNFIVNVIREEEKSFLKTLEQGLVRLNLLIKNNSSGTIRGFEAFELYDTFGFPLDLTMLVAKEKGLTVDQVSFNKHMRKQQDRAREAKSSLIGDWIFLKEDDFTEFIGYDQLETKVRITRYRRIKTAQKEEVYHLVFNLTPFYPEGGGQVGDKGYIRTLNGTTHYIINTTKENNLILHHSRTLPDNVRDIFQAQVDSQQRIRTSCNHTATHLLHLALRRVLGEHVVQKGSMIHSREFRFDFSHFTKLSSEELQKIEDFVNNRIREQLDVEERRNVPFDEARDQGAMALFGEKYGDIVRMIRFGPSIELCGGTHVRNTSEIWHLKILSERAVASGIRRIEAITADTAMSHLLEKTKTLQRIDSLLGKPKKIVEAITELRDQNHQLRKRIEKFKQLEVHMEVDRLLQKVEKMDDCNFISSMISLDATSMRSIAFLLNRKLNNAIIFLGTKHGGKPVISCLVSKELVCSKGLDAVQLVNRLGSYIEGRGGGQAFYASAGGKNVEGLQPLIDSAIEVCQQEFLLEA